MRPRLFDDSAHSMDIVFERRHHPYLPDTVSALPAVQDSQNKNGYFGDDMPAQTRLSANRSHIYIDGALKPGAKITLRQGIASASHLGKDAEISGGMLLIISNEELSQQSRNNKDPQADHPTILIVPEEERARIFDAMAQKIGHHPHYPPVEELKALLAENPRLKIKIIPGSSQHHAALQEAGLLGRSP